tara:strand:- start:473 stop:1156 length:684 start_codon:yes stop_codon:yes gene_type:complete
MAALSDYLESGVLNHIFRGSDFPKPSAIAIALTSDVAKDSQNGSNIPELPTTNGSISTGYARIDLGSPATSGNSFWNDIGLDDSTAFAVFAEDSVEHSGYFYPLYLTSNAAETNDVAPQGGTTGFVEYTFNDFEETFYAPANLDESGVSSNPGYLLYEGNGFIKNKTQLVFNTALTDWGWVSGIAILDDTTDGAGKLLMYAELNNPRYVYTGDSVKFDSTALEISLN